jgi:hypothetical protein
MIQAISISRAGGGFCLTERGREKEKEIEKVIVIEMVDWFWEVIGMSATLQCFLIIARIVTHSL